MNSAVPCQARSLWYAAPGQLELREENLNVLASGCCRVRMLWSGISRGTESLVFSGSVPESEWQRMRAPFQAGEFPFPVKYGYAAVGIVEQGPSELVGKTVFVLHPHQDIFDVQVDAVTVLPEGLPAKRAVLAANMETALNAVWDAQIAPCDSVVVIGAGVVGALAAWLCGQIAGTEITLVDVDAGRAALAASLDVRFALPPDAPKDCDVVIHASGNPAGLIHALSLAGLEATVLEMSWYGDKQVNLPLGSAFHSRRLRLVSSQVGQIPPLRRPRWDYRRRLNAALDLLGDARLDALLAEPVRFTAMPIRAAQIFAAQSGVLAQVIEY